MPGGSPASGGSAAVSVWRQSFGFGSTPPVVWIPATLVAVAMLLPLAYLVFRAAGAGDEVWGLLLRERSWQTLGRTVLLTGAVTAVATVVAVPLAWLTARTDLPHRRMWSVITALPLVIPSYVAAFVVVVALGPRGMFQQVLEAAFGIERIPSIYGLPGAMMTIALLSYPYMLLPVRAALAGMDRTFEENARTLGDSPWTAFRRVTLPQLRPAIAAGALLVALYTLSDFGAVSMLRYETITWAIYVQYESAFDRSIAASYSLVLVALAAGILVLESVTRGRAVHHRTGGGSPRAPNPVRLGPWKWPAWMFCTAATSMALGIPTLILMIWLVRGLLAGAELVQLWDSLANSILASSLAAVATTVLAIPLAVAIVRHRGRFAWFLERVSFIGFALPGVVVALALVFFGSMIVRPLYQTLWLLVFAYVVLFFPAALGAVRTALLQVNPRYEEAARSLGRTAASTAATITIPLMRHGLMAGAALVFLLAIKELPATLILGPLGFKTLATSAWGAASEAFFARAAAPAILTILVSSVPLAIMLFSARPGRLSRLWRPLE